MFMVDHAGYALHRLIGSENPAYFSIDCRDELEEILVIFSMRIREFVQSAIASGVACPFVDKNSK